MTTETMTVHKALCELKTLDARIVKAMQQKPFVFSNKQANRKISGISVDEYSGEVKAAYQSTKDLMARRDAIKRAVTLKMPPPILQSVVWYIRSQRPLR